MSLCFIVRLQLQATAVSEVLIKGICANRYLAMSADGRLFGTVRFSIIKHITRNNTQFQYLMWAPHACELMKCALQAENWGFCLLTAGWKWDSLKYEVINVCVCVCECISGFQEPDHTIFTMCLYTVRNNCLTHTHARTQCSHWWERCFSTLNQHLLHKQISQLQHQVT